MKIVDFLLLANFWASPDNCAPPSIMQKVQFTSTDLKWLTFWTKKEKTPTTATPAILAAAKSVSPAAGVNICRQSVQQ